MRQLLIIAAATGGLSLAFGGTTASAGYCGQGVQPVSCQMPIAPPPPPCGNFAPPMLAPPAPAVNCAPSVVVNPGAPYMADPVVMGSSQPMDHLRSIRFHNSPHVNIMRVHGQNSGIGLKDAPTGFTSGCHPSSTTYCGQQQAAAPAPGPYIAPPVPAPAPAPVVQRQSYQYGSTGLVRGTAYLPTSHVNRDYQTAVNVLNSGPIPARPAVNGGEVPHPSMFQGQQMAPRPMMMRAPAPAPVMASPMPRPLPVSGSVVSAPAYGPGPGNWEKVSGPTMVGGMQATQVVCRRPAPAPAPVTCVRQPVQAPLMLAGPPPSGMSTSRYSSGH